MATVGELKQKARDLEQQGDFARAIKVYEHILKFFEGNPEFVKVHPAVREGW